MPEARIGFRPFDEQLAFFLRKVNVPTARWDDLRLGDHAHGFMVAGLARQDVLNDLREAIVKAMQGETLDDFRKRFDDFVRGRWEGFTGDGSVKGRAWRTRIIYQTNMRTSYMAGRWETLRKFPYLRYNHHTIVNPRENHLAWDDKIIATNDPWWSIHYPPNGWGCRCDATGVSDQRLRAMGRKPDAAPAAISGDPPPEWSYHVGEAARSLPAAAAFGERVMRLPPAWRDLALIDAQQRRVDTTADWPATVRLIAEGLALGVVRPTGVSAPVGFLSPQVATALTSGVTQAGEAFVAPAPVTALLSATDGAALHVLRDTKFTSRRFGREPRPDELRDIFTNALSDLPEQLSSAETSVYWDPGEITGSRGLVFVVVRDGRLLKYVFGVSDQRKTQRAQVTANWLKTVEVTTPRQLSALTWLAGPQR